MDNLEYNYHTHTSRCGHAFGKDEEYVLNAIKQGYKRIGFSDHVILPGIIQPGMRGDPSLLDDYIYSVHYLRDKYKDKIEIKLGFECEWYGDKFKSYYESLLKEKGFDYLILGQHCRFSNDRIRFYGDIPFLTNEERCKLYVDDLCKGISSGLFSYVCHPDVFIYFFGYLPSFKDVSYKIALTAKEHNIPLEINLARTRPYGFPSIRPPYEQIYPFPPFWEIVKEVGNEIVVGVDAHKPTDFISTPYKDVNEFIKTLGLKVNKDFRI